MSELHFQEERERGQQSTGTRKSGTTRRSPVSWGSTSSKGTRERAFHVYAACWFTWGGGGRRLSNVFLSFRKLFNSHPPFFLNNPQLRCSQAFWPISQLPRGGYVRIYSSFCTAIYWVRPCYLRDLCEPFFLGGSFTPGSMFSFNIITLN